MDDVELEFEDEAIECIAQEALKRKTGARGLRSIVEELMLDIMYEVPSNKEVKKFVVTPELVRKRCNIAEIIQMPKNDKKKHHLENEIA
jgi:ATP-dependent Clp protease ATP-binding subunit ClpX